MAGFQFCSKLDTYLNLPQFICLAPKADSGLGFHKTQVHDPNTASCILRYELFWDSRPDRTAEVPFPSAEN